MMAVVTSNAQGTGDTPSQERRGLFDKNKTKKDKTVDSKYLVGACPVVAGKIQWDTTIEAPGVSADALYKKVLSCLTAFCKGPEMMEFSKVSLANEETHEIGARIQEWLVFEKKPLSLDRTKFNYQLVVTCKDGACSVVMRNLSYIYEEDRGGGQFPAEYLITDEEALTKTKDGFRKGGVRKFRMKTIDRKDYIFSLIAEAVKK